MRMTADWDNNCSSSGYSQPKLNWPRIRTDGHESKHVIRENPCKSVANLNPRSSAAGFLLLHNGDLVLPYAGGVDLGGEVELRVHAHPGVLGRDVFLQEKFEREAWNLHAVE